MINDTASIPFIPLDSVYVATPCRADWERMRGDNRVRFCPTCTKNVYNLSAMSRAEAEKLINDKEGNLCARYYQRADGTVLTADCPVGVRILRGRMMQDIAAGLVAAVVFGFGLIGIGNHRATIQPSVQSFLDVRQKVIQWLYPVSPYAVGGALMTTTAFTPNKNMPGKALNTNPQIQLIPLATHEPLSKHPDNIQS